MTEKESFFKRFFHQKMSVGLVDTVDCSVSLIETVDYSVSLVDTVDCSISLVDTIVLVT